MFQPAHHSAMPSAMGEPTPLEEAMATKSNFSSDEWKVIMSSPMLAGMAVTLAEPSGIWGMMKEGMASGYAVFGAKPTGGGGELAKGLVADMETWGGPMAAREALKSEFAGKSPAEIKQQVRAALTRAGQILDAKAPAD